MSFIDPITLQPHRLGELYSDRHIMITGKARWDSATNQVQIDPTTGLSIITTPLNGGSAAITTIAGGTNLQLLWDAGTSRGSSVWIDINRMSGTKTVTVGNGITICDSVSVPKPTESAIMIMYRASTTDIIATASFVIGAGPLYTKLGTGTGQRVFAAIVGDDVDSTHSDLQLAINEVATGSWILVKKMVTVATTINTGGKVIKLHFVGYGTGLTGSAGLTGMRFDQPGCQMVGFGEIKNFSGGIGVNLNNQDNCRLEMVFSSNSTNINYGTLTSAQVNVQGSYGLTENSTIELSTVDGSLSRWNDTKKRWEPVLNATLSSGGTIATTASMSAARIIGTTVSGTTVNGVTITGTTITGTTISGSVVYGAVYN
jgi:hypothetical protein